jgi:hypothetical protein
VCVCEAMVQVVSEDERLGKRRTKNQLSVLKTLDSIRFSNICSEIKFVKHGTQRFKIGKVGREVVKILIILIITCTCDLPFIITISDTSKNEDNDR